MRLTIQMADPAGNRTVFVHTPVPKQQRAELSAELLKIEALHGEQVGFIVPPTGDAAGRLEMMGGEFCGNAARSFGYLLAEQKGLDRAELTIEISGASDSLKVSTDRLQGTACAEMPRQGSIVTLKEADMEIPVVILDGIEHAIVFSSPEPTETAVARIRNLLRVCPCEAAGILYRESGRMTPLVYVPAADSLVWENSCGSGSLACGIYDCRNETDGVFETVLTQPGGTIAVTVEKADGTITSCRIGGSVTLEPVLEVDL